MPSVYRSTVIDSLPARVWQAIRDFHDISWASGVLQTCAPIGDHRGDQVGARRILNGSFHETLLALDDLEHAVKYRLDQGPSPVSPQEVQNFVSVIRVRPVTDRDRAFVEWSAMWEARDDRACEFASGIYAAALAALAGYCGRAPVAATPAPVGA